MRPGERADNTKALISYQPQEEDFSSPFLHLLQREGHHNLQRSANPLLPANGARPLFDHGFVERTAFPAVQITDRKSQKPNSPLGSQWATACQLHVSEEFDVRGDYVCRRR